MRAASGFVLQLAAASAASHISCVFALLDPLGVNNCNKNININSGTPTSGAKRWALAPTSTTNTATSQDSHRDVTRALFFLGGWRRRERSVGENCESSSSAISWWVYLGWRRWRRRPRQAENTTTVEVVKREHDGVARSTSRRAEKHMLLVKHMLRRIRRLLGAIVDIATLKRLRQLRLAKTGVWQNGGPIPVQYRPLLQELRDEIAACPGLEKRARRVDHELDTITLGRYLEAAYWSTEHDDKRVVEYISDTIAWRESIGAHKLRKEDVVARGAKGAILVKGHDLHRRPVVYFRPALDGRLDGDDSAKLMIYTLERAIRLMPRGTWQYTIVIDCHGIGLGHLPPLPYMKKMFKMLSSHYPMRLGSVLYANAGPGMLLCWRVVSPLLHRRTKLKMHFIPATKLEMMNNFIDPAQLLPFVGGQSLFVLDTNIYFSNDAASL